MCIVTFGAEFALVYRIAVPWRDAYNLLVFDNKVKAATGSAIRARGWYVLYFHKITSYNCGLDQPTLNLVIYL
jgi:hypothetical protein